jgi:hypothetical protein
MPAILAIWEAEIGQITVPGQLRQEVCETPISSNNWHGSECLSQAIQEAEIGRVLVLG